MARSRSLLCILLALIAFAGPPALAAAPDAGIFALAEYVPFNASAYVAVATDDAHLADLDGVFGRARTLIGDLGVQRLMPSSFRQLLANQLADGDEAAVARFFDWSGDAIALATNDAGDGSASQTLIVIPLDDRAGAERDLLGLNAPEPLGTFGRYDLYALGAGSRYLLFADDVLLMAGGITQANAEILAGGNYPRLTSVEDYTAAVSSLPEARYNVGVYFDARRFVQAEVALDAAIGEGQAKAVLDASLALGGTLLDGETLTLDVAVVPAEPLARPLMLQNNFARHIPGRMGASIHGADLAALINNLLDMLPADGSDDARTVVTRALQMVGLEFDAFMGWTKGDYALFARVDLRPAIPGLMAIPPDVSGVPGAVDMGIVIEAVDPQRTQAFTAQLSAMLRAAAVSVPTVRVRDEVVNDVALTVVSFDTEMDTGAIVTVEFGVGASDEVFALGTIGAVRDIFNGVPGRPQGRTFIDSERYWLPASTSRWVIDGEMVASLITYQIMTSVVSGRPTVVQIESILDRLTGFIDHATISTTVSAEGYALVRATITLGEQP